MSASGLFVHLFHKLKNCNLAEQGDSPKFNDLIMIEQDQNTIYGFNSKKEI